MAKKKLNAVANIVAPATKLDVCIEMLKLLTLLAEDEQLETVEVLVAAVGRKLEEP